MSESRDNSADMLESQIDAMLDEADGAAPAPDPQADAPEPSPTDPVGEELANQVQQMLDEASQEQNLSAEQDADDSSATLDQLDNALADEADNDLEGDFETVEQAMGHPPAAAEADAPQAPDTTVDEATGEGLDDFDGVDPNNDVDELAGDMQTVDQVTADGDEPAAQPAAPAETSDDADTLSAEAQAVADELDADAAQHYPTEPALSDPHDMDEEPAGDPEPAAAAQQGETAPPAAEHDQPPPDTAPASAKPTEARKRIGAGLGLGRILTSALIMINAPVLDLPQWQRDMVGFIGLQTIAVAVCLMIYGSFGPTACLSAAGVLVLPLLAALYYMFIRIPGRATTTSADG